MQVYALKLDSAAGEAMLVGDMMGVHTGCQADCACAGSKLMMVGKLCIQRVSVSSHHVVEAQA